MGKTVEGGIEKHQDLKRFSARAADVAVKEQIDLMSRCWFSLTPNRTEPIEHEFVDARSKQTEKVRITGTPEHGIATIHDQDLLIFAISQWVEAKRMGLEPSRRIAFTPYQFFTWMNKAPNGKLYARLKDALHRLKMTNIETTIRSESRRRDRVRQFSWISEWELTEENGVIRGVEVVLAEWLFESIKDFHVLTLDKRYFDIPGSVERWLYLYARKATGGVTGQWKESFKSLYRKSASQQAYKHYASALRKLAEKNELPGLRLERQKSVKGRDMLLMERTERGEAAVRKVEEQMVLIERTPLEDAWECVLDDLRRQLSAPTVNSWLIPLNLVEFADGTLTYRAPTKFIGQWVESHYGAPLRAAWLRVGYEVSALKIEAGELKLKAGTEGEPQGS
jgi:plasmid replication initiation protein